MNVRRALKYLYAYLAFVYSINIVQCRHDEDSGPAVALNKFDNAFSRTPEFKNISSYKHTEEPKQKNEPVHPKFRLVIVDINDKKSNELVEYRYNSSSDTHIFTAIEPSLIKRVMDGDKVLWDSGNKEFANEIFLKYNSEGNPTLRIKSFGDESPRDLIFSSKEANLKNAKHDDLDTYKTNENKLADDQTKVSEDINYRILWKPRYSEHYGKALLIPDSEGRLSVKAIFPQPKKLELVPITPEKSLEEAPEELASKEAGEFPKETEELLKPKEVIKEEPKPKKPEVKEGDVALIVPKNKLKEILDSEIIGIVLNINSTSSTDEYSFTTNEVEDKIFAAKAGYGFMKVKGKSSTIWEAKDKAHYAEFVDIYDTGLKSKDLVVFMYNREVVRFRRPVLSTIWYKKDDHKEFAKYLNKDNTAKKLQTEYVMGYSQSSKSGEQCNSFVCVITFGLFQCC